MPKSNSPFKRQILAPSNQAETIALLQQNLVNLIDLALSLKQAHWNVVGPNFRAVHLQLDEIIETVRNASDETAERVSTLGVSPDGRAATIASTSHLKSSPEGFQTVEVTVSNVADALKATIDDVRQAIDKLNELDPVSQDMLIGIARDLEKHLWMVQAQET